MRRKILGIYLIAIICIVGIFTYRLCSIPDGATVDSREQLLESAIPKAKGSGWTIAKEIELEGHIISAAYSTDNKVSLAVFEPIKNGKYRFMTSTNRDSDDIIISGVIINGSWYDLIWFNGAETEYAEITYTIDLETQDTLRYDTTAMDIIFNKNAAEASYSMSVVYFDSDGNKYE